MAQIVGLKELRENLPRYAKEVGRGKSFIVVKRSKLLFKVSPVTEGELMTAEERRSVARGRREFAKGKYVTLEQIEHELGLDRRTKRG